MTEPKKTNYAAWILPALIVGGLVWLVFVNSSKSGGEGDVPRTPTESDRREAAAALQRSIHEQGKTRVTIHAVGVYSERLEIGAWNCDGAILDEMLPSIRSRLRDFGFVAIECPGGSPSRSTR